MLCQLVLTGSAVNARQTKGRGRLTLDLLLLGVGEGGRLASLDDGFSLRCLYVDECCGTVADCRYGFSRRPELPQELDDVDVCGQVEVCAVPADDKDGLVVRVLDVKHGLCVLGRVHGLLRVVKVRHGLLTQEILDGRRVQRSLAALRASKVDLVARLAEDGVRVCGLGCNFRSAVCHTIVTRGQLREGQAGQEESRTQIPAGRVAVAEGVARAEDEQHLALAHDGVDCGLDGFH